MAFDTYCQIAFPEDRVQRNRLTLQAQGSCLAPPGCWVALQPLEGVKGYCSSGKSLAPLQEIPKLAGGASIVAWDGGGKCLITQKLNVVME